MSTGKLKIKLVGASLGRLVAAKNAVYGDSVRSSAAVLEILYPDGVKPDQFRDMLLIARVLDKLSRIANRKDAFGESPWRDIAGYGLLATAIEEAEAASGETLASEQEANPGQ